MTPTERAFAASRDAMALLTTVFYADTGAIEGLLNSCDEPRDIAQRLAEWLVDEMRSHCGDHLEARIKSLALYFAEDRS
jgi:hypothetical protein